MHDCMHPAMSRLALLAWLASARATTLSFRRPSEAAVGRYLSSLHGVPFNHDFVHATTDDDSLGRYRHLRLIRYECELGRGGACYRTACTALLDWGMHRGSRWCGLHTRGAGGDPLCTVAAMGPLLWVTNPCRVVYARRGGRHSAVAYATLRGHLLAGTEAMRVDMAADGMLECAREPLLDQASSLVCVRADLPLGMLLEEGSAGELLKQIESRPPRTDRVVQAVISRRNVGRRSSHQGRP